MKNKILDNIYSALKVKSDLKSLTCALYGDDHIASRFHWNGVIVWFCVHFVAYNAQLVKAVEGEIPEMNLPIISSPTLSQGLKSAHNHEKETLTWLKKQ